jgi:hypothetical protein
MTDINTDPVLVVWTVYRNPRDYPGKWVLRGHDVTAGNVQPRDSVIVADTYAQLSLDIPPGLTHMPRHSLDDPAIYESWI